MAELLTIKVELRGKLVSEDDDKLDYYFLENSRQRALALDHYLQSLSSQAH